MTDTPNDIDVTIYSARLEAMADMYITVVKEYRAGLLRALCDWAEEFIPKAKTIRLVSDVDWRWCLDALLDEQGRVIDGAMDVAGDYDLSDVFSPGYLSELPDDAGGTAVIDIATCTFAPGTGYELRGRTH